MKNIFTIFEDNHLLVVEKPINVPTQPDSSNDADLLSLLKNHLKEKHNKPGNVFLGLVHRLDRPVGGVILFAKNSKSAARISEQIREQTLQKTYLAIVHGNINKKADKLQHYLLKNEKLNKVEVFDKPTTDAQKALLSYEVIESKNNLSLVKIQLITGRPHQIRAQFSFIKHPLFADKKYGSKEKGNIALWSSKIICEHPVSKETLTFSSLPPRNQPWRTFSKCSKPL